jgi:hypothetical protein
LARFGGTHEHSALGTRHSALGLILLAGFGIVADSSMAQVSFRGFIRPQVANSATVPDPEIAVGPTRLVGITNDEIGFFDLDGTLRHKRFVWPVTGSPDLGFFEIGTQETADPEVLYDTHANRFWAMQFANAQPGNNGVGVVIAISDDNDPTGLLDPVPTPEGTWRKWKYSDTSFPLADRLDSPNIAVDSNWVYLEGALRNFIPGDEVGHRIWIWPKAPLMNTVTNPPPFNLATTPGVPAPQIYDFPFGPNEPVLDATGLVQKYTYDNSPQFTIAPMKGNNKNQIEIRAFRPTTGGTTPQVWAVTLTLPAGFEYSQPVPAPQPGINSLPFLIFDARFWGTPVYRNGSIWACQTVTPGTGTAINRVQWLEVKINGWPDLPTLPSIHQIGLIASPERHCHFPSIAVNNFGDACITYSESSTTIYPTMRRAMRKASDPLGTLPDNQAVYASTSTWSDSPSNGTVRWGDYSGTDTSKNSRCDFWGTHEYYADDSTNPPGPVSDDRYRVRIVKYNVCRSDFDLSGEIETTDILAFQDLYNASEAQADLTEDESLSIDDQIMALDLILKGMP